MEVWKGGVYGGGLAVVDEEDDDGDVDTDDNSEIGVVLTGEVAIAPLKSYCIV